ncbi:MAG: D-alanyl-D-alanine carboxypeptidase/D-alanyl-D-alanine-endopeptidase [candidate division KSB1 bacterium]|nr:D-alanyl-D-alanine carboxypeptidase/D-alanyl-D-alanine-endopeptidase [candidate division KSB1 bacterium]
MQGKKGCQARTAEGLRRDRFTARFLVGILVVSGLSASGCAPRRALTVPDREAQLRADIEAILDNPAFSAGQWGVVIQSLRDGRYLLRRNPHKAFMPASNLKLFTTATALAKLGPEYRYVTRLYRTGPIVAGTLQGDLVIRGVGDPSITGRYHNGDPLAVFRSWVDSLRALGVRRISGRVIGDDDWFEEEILGAGWSWDYESDWYAAQISALSFNDNCVDIVYRPGARPGDPVAYELTPDTRYVQIDFRVATVRRGLEREIVYQRKRASNFVRIDGALAAGGESVRDWFSVENPTLYAAFVFRELLERSGIAVDGGAFDKDDLPGYAYVDTVVVARYVSPPMSELCKTVNKVSQNLYAELILRTLGKHFRDVGSASQGIEVVKEFVSGLGIDPNQLVMVDGSGLSRYNYVTPQTVATLLRAMRRHPYGHYFYDSLPIAGVDGTLKRRMVGTAAEGNVRAKTGYIENVRALSGYVTTLDGEELVFSLIVNHYLAPTSVANDAQDLICQRLASFSSR